MSSVLQADIPDNVLYQHLLVVNPMDPKTWRIKTILGNEKCLDDQGELKLFVEDTMSSLKVSMDQIFISLLQDADGQHRFVSLGEVKRFIEHPKMGQELMLIAEAEVKALEATMKVSTLFARAQDSSAPRQSVAQPIVKALEKGVSKECLGARDSLCPKSSPWGCNYDVIPDLSLGLTQRLILCDEATLTRSLPEERIFEHLTLIVNCHEVKFVPGKYKIGSCKKQRGPDVICEAVHGWHSDAKNMNSKNDAIQSAIWQSLQHGTVAVHCLAGIHRAACIVACHFLYRHYVLGHSDIPCDMNEIYRRLKAARPHVDPAYGHVFKSYEAHLKARVAQN